jgi:hypothetical protein
VTAVTDQQVDVAPMCVTCSHGVALHDHADGCEMPDCPCVKYEPFRAGGERSYSAREVVVMTGATYRQLDFWLRRGLLGDDTAHGSGSRRRLTLEQLEMVFYAVGLIRAGFTLEAALRAAKVLVLGGSIDITVAEIVRVQVGVRTTS